MTFRQLAALARHRRAAGSGRARILAALGQRSAAGQTNHPCRSSRPVGGATFSGSGPDRGSRSNSRIREDPRRRCRADVPVVHDRSRPNRPQGTTGADRDRFRRGHDSQPGTGRVGHGNQPVEPIESRWPANSAMKGVLAEAPKDLSLADRLRQSVVPSLLEARRYNESMSNSVIELFETARCLSAAAARTAARAVGAGTRQRSGLRRSLREWSNNCRVARRNCRVERREPGSTRCWNRRSPARSSIGTE